MLTNNPFNGKRILVTGHTGFKGSWLSLWLIALGAEVTGYGLDPKTQRDNFVMSDLAEKMHDYRADIRDKEMLFDVVKNAKPDIIFHLAAQSLVLEGYRDPLQTFEVNIQGTANILEAFRQSESASILVVVTTDKVYENKEWNRGYRESDNLGGADPYSASKSAVEMVVASYHNSFFKNQADKKVFTVRAGNVIGGGDWSPDRIIPDCIRALESNREMVIRNPSSVRPWQFVLEPLGGYILLVSRVLNNEPVNHLAWNFGPWYDSHISVEDIVRKIICRYGLHSYPIRAVASEKKESHLLFLDISRAVNELNWKPIFTIDECADLTVNWYRSYMDTKVDELCFQQINEYSRKWNLLNSR